LKAPRPVRPQPAVPKKRTFAEQPPEPEFPRTDQSTAGTTAALLGALVVVCLGVFLLFPGLGILMAIVLVAPLLRTTLIVGQRSAEGRETSLLSRVAMFVGSIFVSGIVIALVAIVGFGTFCITCLGMAATTQNEVMALAVASAATLFALGALAIPIVRWIRSRWYDAL
jgi:hypothetical protein